MIRHNHVEEELWGFLGAAFCRDLWYDKHKRGPKTVNLLSQTVNLPLEHYSSIEWQQLVLPGQCWLSVMGDSRWLAATSLASKAAAVTHSPSPGLCWRFCLENLTVHCRSKAFPNILDLSDVFSPSKGSIFIPTCQKAGQPHISVTQRPGLLGVFATTQQCLIDSPLCSAPGEGLAMACVCDGHGLQNSVQSFYCTSYCSHAWVLCSSLKNSPELFFTIS